MTADRLRKTGNTSGGQSGLRYNPRETAGDEVGYGVSHTKYNPGDPHEKQTEDDDKAKKKEKPESILLLCTCLNLAPSLIKRI